MLQQLSKLLQFRSTEMTEHRFRHTVHLSIQTLEHLAPFVGDAHFDDAAILAATNACHQAAPAEANRPAA